MLTTGSIVDRYRVEAALGSGGVASVFLVRHTVLGSLHALKVLHVTSPVLRERLVREGRLQARLRHPNLVTVTDMVDVDEAPALVLEYVEGPTLAAFLAGGRPALDEALRLFDGIAGGVEHAHAAGILHRDLKPANVLIATRGGAVVPKVADFGLAKAVDETLGEAGATRTNTAMGTPQYMAPEQIRNARDVDARADIFALGCLLYELVCGRAAFEGRDTLAVWNAITAGNFTRPGTVRPDLPDRVVRAVEACLQPDPAFRPPTVAHVRQMLEGTPGESPGEARPTAVPPERLDLRSREASLPALPSVSPTMGIEPPGADSGSAGGRARRRPLLLVGVGIVVIGAALAGVRTLGASEHPEGVSLPTDAPGDPAVTGGEAPPPLAGPESGQAGLAPADPAPADPAAVHPAPADPAPPTPAPSVSKRSPATKATGARSRGLRVEGDAAIAWIEAGGQALGRGPVDPGTYTIQYMFEGVEGVQSIPGVRFGASELKVIVCDRRFVQCRLR